MTVKFGSRGKGRNTNVDASECRARIYACIYYIRVCLFIKCTISTVKWFCDMGGYVSWIFWIVFGIAVSETYGKSKKNMSPFFENNTCLDNFYANFTSSTLVVNI